MGGGQNTTNVKYYQYYQYFNSPPDCPICIPVIIFNFTIPVKTGIQ
jgi:hypothetical protein